MRLYPVPFLVFWLMVLDTSLAHQPVMDMAPRWENGYGFQIRHENFSSDTLLNQDSEVPTTVPVKMEVNKLWVEGIYTFKRWIRLSFKLPYVTQSKVIDENAAPVKKTGNGVGDLEIGLPLKLYTNLKKSTGNIAFTPSVRFPSGSTKGAFPVSDGSTDFGLSFSKSLESEKIYQYYDVFLLV